MLDLHDWTDNEVEIEVFTDRRRPGIPDSQVESCLETWATQRQTIFFLRQAAGKSRSRLYWAMKADTLLEVLRPATAEELKGLEHMPRKAKAQAGQGRLF